METFIEQAKKILSHPLVKWILIAIGIIIAIALLIPPIFTKAKEAVFGKEPSKEREDKANEGTKLGFSTERAKQLYDTASGIADAFHTKTRPALDLNFMPDISRITPYYWWEDEETAIYLIKQIKSKEEFSLVTDYYFGVEITPKRNLKADIIKYIDKKDYQQFEWLWI